MLESQTSGELALMRLVITVFSRTNSSPNRSSQMRTLSSPRSGLVTEPMHGLSEYLTCAYTISKCRLLTGRSTGSANGAAGMMDVRAHVSELDEILEVFERAVAAALVEVVDEWRAVVGREHHRIAAYEHVTLGM